MSPRMRLVNPDGGPGYQGNVIGRFVARHPVAVQVVLILAAVLIVGGAMFAPSCEGAEPEKPSRLARYAYYGALHGGDVLSTEYALQRGRHESNPAPWAKSSAGRVVSKALGTVILAEADLYLSRKKHKKTKWVVRVASGAAMGWAIRHNMQAGQ